jgi:predicted lipoprotein with Yx(FWY)xxD motif
MNAIRITLLAVALCALAACTGETGTPPAADTSLSLSGAPPSEATESSSVSASASGAPGQSSVNLDTAKVQGVGTVLVGQGGHTVYLFTNDTGSTSTCTGSCESTWPGVISAGQPTVSGAVDDSKIGTNAAGQVTYNGHPLYYYSGDSKAGIANGQGIGGVWFAVTPDGNPAGQADDNGGGNNGNG